MSDSEKTDANKNESRREFIEKTLKLTAGAYVGMNVVEGFVGPKLGKNAMPLFAASGSSPAAPSKGSRIIDGSDRPVPIDELKKRKRRREG